MSGLNLSFSMREAGWRKAILVVAGTSLGVMSPVIYGVWWGFCGGQRVELRHSIEKTLRMDPVEEAEKAIAEGNYSLYSVGGFWESRVPGQGMRNERYSKKFGYSSFGLFYGDEVTSEDEKLNRVALKYLETYNRHVFAYVNRNFPDWASEEEGCLVNWEHCPQQAQGVE